MRAKHPACSVALEELLSSKATDRQPKSSHVVIAIS